MIRGALILIALASVIFFPWPYAAVLALIAAAASPVAPLAAGLLADTLYYAPHASTLPIYTLIGALVSIAAFFVRKMVATSIIGG